MVLNTNKFKFKCESDFTFFFIRIIKIKIMFMKHLSKNIGRYTFFSHSIILLNQCALKTLLYIDSVLIVVWISSE